MTSDRPDAVNDNRPSLFTRIMARIVPEMPDFYALLIDQCTVTANGTERLVRFLEGNCHDMGAEVRRLEHEGDRIKAKNLGILHRSFATPMDREDFYDAVMAIDEILNYAKTSVREVEILGVSPDLQMVEMARLLDAGTQALLLGFQHLERDPEAGERYGEQARKAERNIEKAYRRALAALFDPSAQLERLRRDPDIAASHETDLDRRSEATLMIVTQILKRREVYRHLSNAGDHVAHAAQILEDIVNKAN